VIELREAKLWHCGAISHRLRREHRTLLNDMKLNFHAEAREVFESSPACRKALYIDGKLAAIGGVTGTAMSREGEIWVAVTEEVLKHPVTVARLFKRELEKVMETRHRLVTLVFRDDRRGMMLAYFLGFRASESRTINGREAAVMELMRWA
jgi:hypothetical protein